MAAVRMAGQLSEYKTREWIMEKNLRIAIVTGFFMAIVSCTMTFGAATLPPEIENPECLGINKEPAHATLMPYGNLKEALAAKRHASSLCKSLNGMWKFNYVAAPDQRPVDFYKADFDVSSWKDIPVPSCWQLLGYGTPYYKNFGYTFQKDWPRVMSTPPILSATRWAAIGASLKFPGTGKIAASLSPLMAWIQRFICGLTARVSATAQTAATPRNLILPGMSGRAKI
jgi:hypothetical protein